MDIWDYGYKDMHHTSFNNIPLSMPSAPSRTAASKLASVFSGKVAEALEAN